MMPEFALDWTRSSYCADTTCIEVAVSGEQVWLRDGKNVAAPAIEFSLDEWDIFIDSISSVIYTFD